MPHSLITDLVEANPHLEQIQVVWSGLHTPDSLEAFQNSGIPWAAADVRINPIDGDVVLRNKPFSILPLQPNEQLMTLNHLLDALRYQHKNIKLNVMTGGPTVPLVLKRLSNYGFNRLNAWFNGNVEHLQEEGFSQLRHAHPGAIIQCPIDFLASLLLENSEQAKKILDRVTGWGVNRFAISYATLNWQQHFEQMISWGYEIDIYGVPNVEAFLQAALLKPRSITVTFNLEQAWQEYRQTHLKNGRPSEAASVEERINK